MVAKYGPDMTHDLAPRAKIFRRDQGNVSTLMNCHWLEMEQLLEFVISFIYICTSTRNEFDCILYNMFGGNIRIIIVHTHVITIKFLIFKT